MDKRKVSNQVKLGLDVCLIVIIVLPQYFWLVKGIEATNREEGLYFFLLALIIGLPYYARESSYIFKFIYLFIITIGLPRRDWALLVYAFSCIVSGIIKIVDFNL